MSEQGQLVSSTAMGKTLDELQCLSGEDRFGFFGPASVTWQLSRECGLFLGAGRAALLQLAHPWVAASLMHHSNLLHDAIGRFHGTFRVIYTMLFGTRGQALAAARQLYALHTTIQGELPARVGSHPAHEHYEANEIGALRWVHATLIDSAVLALETVLPPLSPELCEGYYAESKRLAALCGLSPGVLPENWQAFTQYMAEMLASPQLGVDASGRALGQSVLSGVGTWVRPPRWYRALTASWLPERLRDGFGLTFNAQDERVLRRAQRWLPRLYPLLPKIVRFVGPYAEAQARLRGRTAGPLTRSNNRFWMGRPRLLFPQLSGLAER